MCGLAVIVGSNAAATSQQALRAMLDSIAHRGPDGEGVWRDPAGSCVLGHKRLAIIDPAGGRQPMTNEDESAWIVFNGCIYNHLDLARILRQLGHDLRTASDTEVILHAWEQWGPACVEQFNGMWAFAIWDRKRQTLFCSRDRVGVKPLYWVRRDGVFFAASEIKALIAAGAVDARVNPDGLRQYLTFQFCLGDTTLFDGVHTLAPGHSLIVRPGEEPRISCYWDIDFTIDAAHDEDYFVDRTKWLLEDAVRLQLRSDVPLGAHLSGGLDSSAVVGLTRMLLGDLPLKTFTGAFDEGPAYDETPYARAVAAAARAENLEIHLGPDEFTRSIERIIWHMDEPAAGPGVFPQYWVSKLASEHVKVVLGGQGGDELFIGYARYLVAYLEECLKGAIQNTAHRGTYVATLETIVPSLPSLEGYVPMLRGFWREGLFGEPAARYFRLMDRFADQQSILHPDAAIDQTKTFDEFRSIFQQSNAEAMINRILCFDLKTHLQALLQVEDRTSMAWGLESRVPLLDHRLLELVAAAPPVIKFRNGQLKHLFRHAVKHLVPPVVMQRTDKMGFPVPLTEWMKGPLREFMGDLLLSRTARQRGLWNVPAIETALQTQQPFSRALWGALCLELWHRVYLDRPAPTSARPAPAVAR